jgi:hypothetical protein
MRPAIPDGYAPWFIRLAGTREHWQIPGMSVATKNTFSEMGSGLRGIVSSGDEKLERKRIR